MPNIKSERVRLLLEFAKTYFPASGTVLDIGSVGADDPFLLKAMRNMISSNCTIIAVDLCIKSLAELEAPNLKILKANLYDLPFPDHAFDGCMIAEVLEHFARSHGSSERNLSSNKARRNYPDQYS